MCAAPLLLTTLAGLSTGLGGLIAMLCRPSRRLLAVSAGFAGGVMMAAALSDLVPEAMAFYGLYLPPLVRGVALTALLAAGMVLAGLLDRLLPQEEELAGRMAGDRARTDALRTALITGAALLLHNFPEGVLTFFAGTAGASLGLRTTLAVALHNIPEGLAVAVPFAFALHSRVRGAAAALVSGLAEPAGALLAMLFLRRWFTPGFLNGTIVMVAGVMVWVALGQLLPAALAGANRRPGLLGMGAGILLMLLGIAALP